MCKSRNYTNIIRRVVLLCVFTAAIMVFNVGSAKAGECLLQVQYEYVDASYYDYDGFHMKVKIINNTGEMQPYRLKWYCKYKKWTGSGYKELELDDTYDGERGYYGTEKTEFVFYPGMGGNVFGDFLYFYCCIVDKNNVMVSTSPMIMPNPMRAKAIDTIEFTDLDAPKIGSKFDSSVTSTHPDQYNAADHVRWYIVNSQTGEEEPIVKDTIATSSKYCCRIYIDTVKGYGIDMDTTTAKVSGTDGKIYWDSAKNKRYVKVWYDLEVTDDPKIVDYSKGIRAMSGPGQHVSVNAINAESYRWQKLENGTYRDITSDDGYNWVRDNVMYVDSSSVVNDTLRCKITGYNGKVIYSTPVRCITCDTKVESSLKYVNEGDKLTFSYTLPSNYGTVKKATWYFKNDDEETWYACADYPKYFTGMTNTTLTIDSVDKLLLKNRCSVKCVIEYNDDLGSIEVRAAQVNPYKGIYRHGDIGFFAIGGEPQVGFQEYYGDTYYFGLEDALMKFGWQSIDDNWYFFKDSGAMLKNEWKQYNGYWYYFDDKGVMVTGWKQIGGKWYFFDNEGRMQTGWLEYKEKTYYLNDKGVMVTGEIMIDGKLYNFGSDGVLIKSAQKQSIWKQIDNKWYYFGSDGARTVGWKNISGKWYYFDTKGIMATSWKHIGAKWYYFGANGAMITGWKQISSKWYYFDVNGAMATGWKQIGSKWYSFDTSGIMETGWKKSGAKWYYLGDSGAMTTGWKQVGANWYYFKADGTMVANETLTISGKTYKFNTNGVWISK